MTKKRLYPANGKSLRELAKEADWKPQKKKGKVSTMTPLTILMGKHKFKSGSKKAGINKKIEHGKRYGKLTVSRKHAKWSETPIKYRCTCDCGKVVHLTAKSILKRDRFGEGCMLSDCSAYDLRRKVWSSPKFSLFAQLKNLLSLDADEVDNSYGGCCYEGIPSASLSDGFKNLWADMEKAIDLESGVWWVHKIDKSMPYMRHNIVLKEKPAREATELKMSFVGFGDTRMKIEEIAGAMGISPERAGQLRADLISDDEFVDRLISESLENERHGDS